MKKPLVLSKLALMSTIKKKGLKLAIVPKAAAHKKAAKKKLPPKKDAALTELKRLGSIMGALMNEQDEAFHDFADGKLTHAELDAIENRLEPKIKKAYKDFVAEEKRCVARKTLTKKARKTKR